MVINIIKEESEGKMIMDISYCGNYKCKRKDCIRNYENMPEGIHSIAYFNEEMMEEECKWYLGEGRDEDER